MMLGPPFIFAQCVRQELLFPEDAGDVSSGIMICYTVISHKTEAPPQKAKPMSKHTNTLTGIFGTLTASILVLAAAAESTNWLPFITLFTLFIILGTVTGMQVMDFTHNLRKKF